MDGSRATSQIGDNSFKSIKRKNKLRKDQLFHKDQFSGSSTL